MLMNTVLSFILQPTKSFLDGGEMTTTEETAQDKLASYFEKADWGFEQLDSETFRAGFVGENGTHIILVRVTEFWIVFSINPFIRNRGAAWGSATLRMLAALNHKTPLAKLSIDEDNDVSLTVDFPVDGFSESSFRQAVLTLGRCADQLLIPLLQVCSIDEKNKLHRQEPK
jgi:hypothetical protein